jgi:hypothetical protein
MFGAEICYYYINTHLYMENRLMENRLMTVLMAYIYEAKLLAEIKDFQQVRVRLLEAMKVLDTLMPPDTST